MFSKLARASLRIPRQHTRGLATPTRTPLPPKDALKKAWLTDPGT